MTNVTWEAVDPELYAQMSKFTVKGAVNETVTAEINVLVVDGDSIQWSSCRILMRIPSWVTEAPLTVLYPDYP